MKTIKQVLIERDGITSAEADELIEEAREQLMKYVEDGDVCGAEDVCQEYFGLEPDYLDELLF